MENYQKTAEGWVWGERLVHKELGIVYSVEVIDEKRLTTLHKHGSLKGMQEYLDKTKAAYYTAGLEDLAKSLCIVNATHALEEDVNHVLNTSCLPPSHFRRLDPTIIKATKILESAPIITM